MPGQDFVVSMLDAMTAVSAQLPDEGITLREFITRACRLCGEPHAVVEATILLAERDGFSADDIVKRGSNGVRTH